MKAPRSLKLGLLLLLALSVQAQKATTARVQTIAFKSALIGSTLPYDVVLPPDYDNDGQRENFPVLYLLHGLGGQHDNWITKTKLTSYAAQYRMIVVTPEGNDGWYTDSATIASDKYETYVLQELIPDVERRFRAIKNRQGRAIAGLSMGGYGALKFGLKHPETFIFAGSMSGAFDPAVRNETNPGFAWGFVRPSILKVFGADGSPVRMSNNLHQLFRDLPPERIPSLPYLYFDCGTEDGFLTTNRELASILVERKIPHEYRQLSGKHDWVYWDQQVQEVLRIAGKRMR